MKLKEDDADHHRDGHDHEHAQGNGHQEEAFARGPHHGRMLTAGTFSVELVIEEEDEPPRFKLYCYEVGRAIDPSGVQVAMELRRLGGRVTHYRFQPRGGYLQSDTAVEEPHSFDAHVTAEHEGRSYRWQFSQVEARVKVSSETADKVGIEVLRAGPARIESKLEFPGEVTLNADRVCHVVPRVAGVVAEARKKLGDVVKEGDVVAVLESRELATARSQYLVQLKREELARINFNRLKHLWEKKVSPEKDFLDSQKALEEAKIERLAAAQKLMALGLSQSDLEALRKTPDGPVAHYELRAPFDGVVITKHMSKGEWVDGKAEILCIADLSTVWVDIIVYPDHLDAVQLGQRVIVRSDATKREATGVVSYLGPLVGSQSRTTRARVVIDNPDGKWRPGTFVTVQLVQDTSVVPVAVRRDAVQTLDHLGSVVFVRYGDQFEARPVRLGRSDFHNTEIRTGLEQGETYAAANSFVLKSQLGTAGLSHSH
ncbi:MAG: efflux RND transporter periplasmic adaptor subunit [Deltaproteobacteria bacterium]